MKSSHLLVLGLILTVIQAQSMTFQPPPPIVPKTLLNFTTSAQDGKVIYSPKLEALNLEGATTSAGPVTNIVLSVFNRSQPTQSKSTYPLTISGNWSHVESSVESLSCSIIYQSNSQNMGLLKWSRVNATFEHVGSIPLSSFTTASVTLDQFRQAIYVGEDCAIMAFATPSGISVYRANADWSNIHLVALPPNFNLQAVSLDLIWVVSNSILYRYDPSTFQYTPMATLPSFQHYNIRSNQGRVLLWGTNTHMVNDFTGTLRMYQVSTNITLWAYEYVKSSGVFNTIGPTTVTGALQLRPSISTGIFVYTSPQLTKLGFGYSPDGSNLIVQAKHVDYSTSQWFDLQFDSPAAFLRILKNIQPTQQLDFNDFFLVIRNGTTTDRRDAATIAASNPIEQAWQVIGHNFTTLRHRSLAADTNIYAPSPYTRQLGNFVKTFVDPYFADRLVVLNIYYRDSTTYDLVQFDYGNIRSNNLLTRTPTPAYINYTEPSTATLTISTNHIYQWGYFQPNGADQTLKVYTVDNSTVDHYRSNVYSLTGSGWSMVFQNHRCKILKNGNSITINVEVNGVYASTAELFPLLGASVTPSSVWKVSSDCSRVMLDGNIYLTLDGNTWMSTTHPSGFTLDTTDPNLTYALSTDGSLWKFTSAGLVQYFVPPVAFPAGSQIFTAGGAIGLAKTTATSAWFTGFVDTGSSLQKCINYSFHDFVAQPRIFPSPSLTKVLVLGEANKPAWMNSAGTMTKADLYVIECPNFQNISLPLDHLQTPANTRVNLGEEFLHFTQVDAAGLPLNDVVYYFKQGKVTLQVSKTPVVLPANTVWIRSQIWRNSLSGVNYLLSEYLWTDPANPTNRRRLVNASQVNGQQAVFNSQNNGTFIAELVEGQLKMCAPGCADCSCSACLTGFVLDTATTSCRPCPPGCSACSSTDTSICSACFKGSYLNSSNSCPPCDPLCQTCSGTALSCNSCPPGQFYLAGQCNLCPLNCFQCSDANTCTTCREGFVVSSTGLCRGCAITCAQCNPLNITECTSCADGLFLDYSRQCVKCPEKCLECGSATVCGVCVDGYTPNAAGVCVLSCQLPCISCLDNQPTKCTACPYPSSPVNNICVPSFPCNTASTCQDCGYGLNYYWTSTGTGATCQPCPAIANCIQCDGLNTYKCLICLNGFYLKQDGTCVACNSNCTACDSGQVCLGCRAGWTLRKGQTEGRCRECQSPCLTCRGDPKYCTTCVSGFTLDRWNCKNNSYIQYQFVITSLVEVVMADIDNIVCMIYALMNGQDPLLAGSNCDKAYITIESLTSGSTNIIGYTTGTNLTANNVNVGSTLGSYTLASSTLTGYGSYAASSGESGESSKTGLIVGVAVGVVALIVVVVAVCVRKQSQQLACSTDTLENNNTKEFDVSIEGGNVTASDDLFRVQA